MHGGDLDSWQKKSALIPRFFVGPVHGPADSRWPFGRMIPNRLVMNLRTTARGLRRTLQISAKMQAASRAHDLPMSIAGSNPGGTIANINEKQ
jgi:hypothetical protein